MAQTDGTLLIENAKIIFRNFAGKASQYNREGERNFAVIIEDLRQAKKLQADGWNVKIKPPKEEGDDEFAYLQVGVSFDNFPPNIYTITSSGKTRLTKEMVELLDSADFAMLDIILNPYDWTIPSGASGRKAYLKTMFATLNEDALELKYSGLGSNGGVE